MRTAKAFLIGVGTAYLFDPRLGRGRRAELRDRALKMLRQLRRAAGKKARFGAGKAEGVYAEAKNVVVPPDASTEDSIVEQRIRSEAFRDVDVGAGEIELVVEDGVATLSGPVPDDETASELVARVSKVTGVKDVVPSLHIRDAA